MFKKIILGVVGLFFMLGVSQAGDVPVIFTWTKPVLEADLMGFTLSEYDELMNLTNNTWDCPCVTDQNDYSLPVTLSYPDGEETTLCFTVNAYDTSQNHSIESNTVCRREDEIPPGGCINLDQRDPVPE